MTHYTAVLSLLVFVDLATSARILGVLPMPGPSHYILGNTIMRALAEKGHDVTVISPFEDKKPVKNGSYKNIILTGLLEDVEEHRKATNMFDMGNMPPWVIMPFMVRMMINITENLLKHQNVQQLLHSDVTFEVVMVEYILNDAHRSLAQYYDCPLVLLSSGGSGWVNNVVGNTAPPSYVPDTLLAFTNQMTFPQRVYNTLTYLLLQSLFNFYLYPSNAALVQKHYPKPLNMYDILYNTSIVLLNSHQSIHDPVPFVPNLIDIGGFHVKPSTELLPQDLQNYLDNAKNGVIYFSMGSNLHSKDMPKAIREEFLKAFAKLKQNVLWKWEQDDLPGKPANLKTSKWFPQQDILAHPNVKVFITHGGMSSTTEITYHGVPSLAIPIFGDQYLNAKILERNGIGLILPFTDISEQSLSQKLNELLTNPKYSQNAKRRSELFRDRLVHPLDAAIYWIEYVVRHKGAPHLRVAAIKLPWYQYHLLDVIAVLIVLIVIYLYVSWRILKLIYRKVFARNQQSSKKIQRQ